MRKTELFSPPRVLAMGFLGVIMLFSLLLMVPFSVREGVALSYIDSLYTCVSAVCVTGLITVDPADTFTGVGQTMIGVMMQIGGLGVACLGTGFMMMLGKRLSLKERTLLREAMNTGTGRGLVRLVREIFLITVVCELTGAVLCYPVFARDHTPLHAVGVSLFHSVAAFNNAGFDILGGMRSLSPYRDSLWLNIVTCLLIITGGIGFLVLHELRTRRFRWKKLSMHARAVLTTTLCLILGGTLLLLVTENITLPDAVLSSVSARTAGFSSLSLADFSAPGLLVMMLLMFIGASPGSTGGGVKTSTFFVLLHGVLAAATNRSEKAFHYALPREAFRKAAVLLVLSLLIVLCSAWLLLVFEPALPLEDALFEMFSAFSTTGLSTGITPQLHTPAKILSMLLMFTGRLGPMTIATLWYFDRGERVHYPEGNISIG